MKSPAELTKERLETLFPSHKEIGLEAPLNPDTGNRLSSRLVNWIIETSCVWQAEMTLTLMCWPNVETHEGKLMVKLWLNQSDKEKGITARRLMKPGKALKHIFPYATDSWIESGVDRMRHDLGERIYTLKTGQSAGDFEHTYTHYQCRMESPNTTSFRKSLANSCMRYTNIAHYGTGGKEYHPVEAYASGDFTIVWVEDNVGKIAARCVVYTATEKPVPAPIYGVCERSMDMVQEYLDSIGAVDSDNWGGARLLKIEAKHGGFIAPYIDVGGQRLTESGQYLIVDDSGEISAESYGGILHQEHCATCESCGARYDPESEGGHVDDMGVCESCLEDSNFCEFYNERTFQNVEIVNLWCFERVEEQYWCESAIEQNATRVNGEYWRDSDVMSDYEGNDFTAQDLYNGEYFLSQWDNEYYPIELMCETEDGEIVGHPELTPVEHWQQNNDGTWSNIQGNLDLDAA